MNPSSDRSFARILSLIAVAGTALLVGCSDPLRELGQAADGGSEAGNICGIPGVKPFDAGVLDPAEVAAGAALTKSLQDNAGNSCSKCHNGPSFSGNTQGVKEPTDDGGVAFPPNLTMDPATGLGCWTTDQIVTAILYGVDNQGQYICQPMPRWADRGVTKAQAHSLAVYLQSLAPHTTSIPSTYCSVPAGWSADAAVQPVDAGTDAHAKDAGGNVDGSVDAGDATVVDGGDNGDATVSDAGQSDAASDASSAPDATDATVPVDAGYDAGFDGGYDSGYDAGFDAGYDAGFDGGYDGGYDAGSDADMNGGADGATDAPTDTAADADAN